MEMDKINKVGREIRLLAEKNNLQIICAITDDVPPRKEDGMKRTGFIIGGVTSDGAFYLFRGLMDRLSKKFSKKEGEKDGKN